MLPDDKVWFLLSSARVDQTFILVLMEYIGANLDYCCDRHQRILSLQVITAVMLLEIRFPVNPC